jgi:transposase-like protein
MTQTLIEEPPSQRMNSAKTVRQSDIDQMIGMADHCAPFDRAIIQAVFQRGVSPNMLANTVGCTQKLIHGRLRRLISRMASPLFLFVVRQRKQWPDEMRQIAEAVVLRGQSQRTTARHLNLSIHRVRAQMQRIEALYECEPSSSEPAQKA